MVFKSVLIKKKNEIFKTHSSIQYIYISTTPHTGRDMQIHKLKRSNQGTCNQRRPNKSPTKELKAG